MTVYLDHAATTPLRPEAAAAMLPWLTERFGNPSGSHAIARAARAAIDEAREIAAAALGVEPGGVIFTGGGTEADNLAISGALPRLAGDAGAGRVRGRAGPSRAPGPADRSPAGLGAGAGVVVCSAVEHHAVLHAAESAVTSGLATECRVVAVHPDGTIDLDRLADALDPTVTVVSIMLANNEVGTIQPLARIARLVRRHAPGAVLHTDAVQAFPWLDVARAATTADLISISAHKFGGPQGTGVLAVRGDVALSPLIHGGGQERDRRSGTHNVAGIVGMAAAMEATIATREATVARAGRLRDRLADELLAAIPGSAETGERGHKIAGNCHLCFDGIESEALLVLLDDAGVCASAGSACASGAMDPSHVLIAMGIDRRQALGSLRLSVGTTTTDDDVDLALKVIPDMVARLRQSDRQSARQSARQSDRQSAGQAGS
jgi:cysteine desulfurase